MMKPMKENFCVWRMSSSNDAPLGRQAGRREAYNWTQRRGKYSKYYTILTKIPTINYHKSPLLSAHGAMKATFSWEKPSRFIHGEVVHNLRNLGQEHCHDILHWTS